MVLLDFSLECGFWENPAAFYLLDRKIILQQISWLENPTTGKNTWFHSLNLRFLFLGQE